MLTAIAKPFGRLLLWFYEITGSYGLAVIMFALVVKLILMPFMLKSKKSSMRMTRLQPRVAEIQKKHAANRQKMNEEIQKLYREENVKPLGGCVWTLIPFPILLALYEAIRYPITIMMGVGKELLEEGGAIALKLTELGFASDASEAYIELEKAQFISQHFEQFQGLSDKLTKIDFTFLGMNLADTPAYDFLWKTDWSNPEIWVPGLCLFIIPIAGGVLTYFSSKISMKLTAQAPEQAQTMKSMNVVMPLVTVWISFVMPAALGIYWIAGMLFSMVQDLITNRVFGKRMEAENAEYNERERLRQEELEAKRRETERLRAENATSVNKNTSKEKLREQEKKEKAAKAAEYERRKAAERGGKTEDEPSRVGDRPYARGRAYRPDRFKSGFVPDEPAGEETVPAETEAETAEAEEKPVLPEVTEEVTAVETDDEVYEDEAEEDFYGEDDEAEEEN